MKKRSGCDCVGRKIFFGQVLARDATASKNFVNVIIIHEAQFSAGGGIDTAISECPDVHSNAIQQKQQNK